MKFNAILLAASLFTAPLVVHAQGNGLDPADILKPLADSWPTYSGDYSGKRYSALKQVDRSNVQHLTLAWIAQVTPGIGEEHPKRRRNQQSRAGYCRRRRPGRYQRRRWNH